MSLDKLFRHYSATKQPAWNPNSNTVAWLTGQRLGDLLLFRTANLFGAQGPEVEKTQVGHDKAVKRGNVQSEG
jgi:hypothetical protein